jgi:peroxiredoxin
MPVTTGQSAPDFALYDNSKQKVTLSEQRGKNVVLLFFPLAFTSVCTAELCHVRDNISVYNNTDAAVFGISVDSPQTLHKFREEQHLNFALLSDFNREASTAYDVLYDSFSAMDLHGVSKRAAFVIDREGLIRYAEVCASAGDQPGYQAIQDTLAKLK